MHRSSLGFGLTLLFMGLCFPADSHALPPAVESRVQAAIQELKTQNAGIEKDACGQLILVQSELVIETQKGVTNRPFPMERRELWGCNSTPGGTIKTGSKFTIDQESSDGETKSIYVRVVMELYFDREKSATLEGRVTNKDGKGMRHAKIKLIHSRNGSVYEVEGDGEGNYEVQVPSGEYTASVIADSCSKSLPKQLCAFGQVGSPVAKHGPFRQDFKLDCTDLMLDIQGSSSMSFNMSEEGMTFKANSTSRHDGRSSLSVDPKTSQITGSGSLLTLFNDDFVDEATFCDEEGCHTMEGLPGGGKFPDHEDQLIVKGSLSGGVAELAIQLQFRPYTIDMNVNLDGQKIAQNTVTDTTEPYTYNIKLPYAEGASAPFDFTMPMDGGTVEYHLIFTLKKKEDAGPLPQLPPRSGSGGNSGSGPSAPPTPPIPGGPGGYSGGTHSGGRVGSPNFVIPQDPDEEEQETDTEVADSYSDSSADIQDMLSQAIGSFET